MTGVREVPPSLVYHPGIRVDENGVRQVRTVKLSCAQACGVEIVLGGGE
jgi:hypothetical protein